MVGYKPVKYWGDTDDDEHEWHGRQSICSADGGGDRRRRPRAVDTEARPDGEKRAEGGRPPAGAVATNRRSISSFGRSTLELAQQLNLQQARAGERSCR